MNTTNNMTEGKPLPLLLRFSVPMLFANVLQLFYTMADSAVVGRILGVTSFASVGATASLHWLVVSVVLGISQGFGVVFAQRFGAKDISGLRRAFVTAAYLAVFISALIGFAGATRSGLFLKLLNTPAELLPEATIYLGWLLGGILITFAYNLLGAMLRAVGDSKTPLIAMIISSIINIVLDFAFVLPFGVAGIAVATLLAQLTACVHCFIVLYRNGVLKDSGFQWDTASAKILLRLGLPLGLRDCVTQIGGVVVQWYINGYGMVFVAGVSIAKRMYSLLQIAGSAFEGANATFVAQNFGAGSLSRIKQGVATARRLMLVSAAIIMAFTLPFSRFILGLLFEGELSEVNAVLDVGVRQLTAMTLGLPFLYLLVLYRSAIEGIGKPLIPVLSGFMEFIFRIASIVLLMPIIGETSILLADPLGWVGALVLLVIAYHVICGKLETDSTVTKASI